MIWATGLQDQRLHVPDGDHRPRRARRCDEAWTDGAHAHLGISRAVASRTCSSCTGPTRTPRVARSSSTWRRRPPTCARRCSSCARAARARSRCARRSRPPATAPLQQRFAGTAWTQCDSWYRDESGRIVANWPGYMREYQRLTETLDPAEFSFAPAPERARSPERCPRARTRRVSSALRLRDRRRRLGRLRARQPALGGPAGARAAARGRRPRPLAEGQDPGGLPEAVPHQARLGLRDRARAARRRARAVHAARQDARRVELDERDALRARPPARLRRLGGAGRARLGLPRRAALLHPLRGQRPRGLGVPRRRRPAARSPSSARRARSDRRLLAASEAAGIPRIADYNGPEQDGVSMFQVTQRDGRRFSAADALPAPGDDAAEPRGAHEGARAGRRARRASAPSACASAAAAAARRSCGQRAR